jgi:hypothetical protein
VDTPSLVQARVAPRGGLRPSRVMDFLLLPGGS